MTHKPPPDTPTSSHLESVKLAQSLRLIADRLEDDGDRAVMMEAVNLILKGEQRRRRGRTKRGQA
jgi:hypothetical protein